MGCSALTFGLEPNLEGEHECLCVYCVMECRVCMMWDARAVWHDGSSPRAAYRAIPDDFLASYLSCQCSSLGTASHSWAKEPVAKEPVLVHRG